MGAGIGFALCRMIVHCCFIGKIAELGRDMLVSGGRLYFEINQEYGRETVDMLAGLGYQKYRIEERSLSKMIE